MHVQTVPVGKIGEMVPFYTVRPLCFKHEVPLFQDLSKDLETSANSPIIMYKRYRRLAGGAYASTDDPG
jgi:hypothetical protein